MKELCNLSAGEIKSQLVSKGIIVGLSLPLVTNGFDEVILSDEIQQKKVIKDCWEIKWKEGFITFSSEVEILEDLILEKITKEFTMLKTVPIGIS